MHEPPLPRSQGRKQRGSPRAADLLGGLARELFERVLAVRPEAVRVEPRVDRLAQPLGGDAAHENLETREALALVGEERLHVVADQLEEQLVALRIPTADLDQQSGRREQLRQRGLDERNRLGVRRTGRGVAFAGGLGSRAPIPRPARTHR